MSDFTAPPSIPPTNQKNKVLGALAAGFVLLVALAAIRNVLQSELPQNIQETNYNLVPLATGQEPIQELFIRAGCPVCHYIPGIPGANGQVSPPLWLGKTGGIRLADPQYHGQAKTVRYYIIESIVSPETYVAPGFSADTMPIWYGRKLSAAALDMMVSYLEETMER